MFKYEKTYALKISDRVVDVRKDRTILLLLPEMLNDIVFKVKELCIEAYHDLGINSENCESFSKRSYLDLIHEYTWNTICNIVRRIANFYELEVPDIDVKEQLIWLINEMSKKGVYIFILGKDIGCVYKAVDYLTDLQHSNLSVSEIYYIDKNDLISGVSISDGDYTITSFDEKDISFIRTRTNKNNEESDKYE